MLRTAALRRALARASPAARSLSTTTAASASEAEMAFRRFGHLEAKLDPLGLAVRPARPELAAAASSADPAEVERLRATYSGYLGAEFEHLDSAEEREWFAEQMAAAPSFSLSTAQKRNAARAMLQAEAFELFLQKKYPTLKRYSGEGTETLLPALDAIFAAAAASDVSDVVIGQAHRGRLATLVAGLGYPFRALVHKINGNDDFPEAVQGVDDVTSHISISSPKAYLDEAGRTRKVRVSLLPNPSHLEAVNPVAAGKARAKRDTDSPNAMCLLVHGDAAVYGQGVVAETYGASLLPGYSVGGTVHVVTNNQVGFTADERTSRSSTYASDTAKMVGAPVLHVNAEAIREVLWACRTAVAYRSRFGKDVVIDLIGFRKHGHNELDAAEFTQPAMYSCIAKRPSIAQAFAASLAADGSFPAEAKETFLRKVNEHFEAEFQAAKTFTAASGSTGEGDGVLGSGKHVVGDGTAFGGKWSSMRQATPAEMLTSPPTGAPLPLLRAAGKASVTVRSDFAVHDRLQRGHIAPRLAAVSGPEAAAEIDWATAEALAMGSLLAEGHDIRMSGQDAQRGTFSHRHAVFVSQKDGSKTTPFNEALTSALAAEGASTGSSKAPGKLHIYSSLLSEFGVLGFETGYSWESPNALVLWEAQFGDFANGAQIIIDQFTSGAESKWLRQSGLVMLLPHGYDGAGPEHSSARIERFLQLVNSQGTTRMSLAEAAAAYAGDKTAVEATNMIVANPTTPANYFHLLRRQMARPFRKPLVVIAPKTLLRHPAAKSSLLEMASGTAFEPVLTEKAGAGGAPADSDVNRVVLCSGKLHLELAARRAAAAAASSASAARTAIVRVEELAPFPTDAIMATLAARFPGLKAVDWVQEEPANAGAWTWAEAHMAPALAAAGLPPMRFTGRPALAAPAVGLSKRNKAQQDALLARAFA